jgi:hypothetical protein
MHSSLPCGISDKDAIQGSSNCNLKAIERRPVSLKRLAVLVYLRRYSTPRRSHPDRGRFGG